MKIYTSYFEQLKNFPDFFTPVAICGGIPDWYDGLWYRKVAPKWKFFQEWEQNEKKYLTVWEEWEVITK